MDARQAEDLRRILLRQRAALLREVTHLEADLEQVTEDRETEIEEAAQEARTARVLLRLDDRGKAELEEIDRALGRIANDAYGICEGCGDAIPLERLSVLPATPHCRGCAERVERGEPLDVEPKTPRRSAKLPADYALLSERELEDVIRDHLREDGRVDMEELRIVCRRGVAYLDGVVPSQGERQILLQIVTDVMGLTEVEDRLQVKEILWEREDRDKPELLPDTKLWEEPVGTEDVTETSEQGADYVAPSRPVPDEE
jgi:RNA polymerase-binding protein DksA